MALGPDDITPNPDALPTHAELAAAFLAFRREMRVAVAEMRKEFGQHVEISFSPLEDRVDLHDVAIGDLKRLMISHQTANGLSLKAIQDGIAELIVEMRALKKERGG